MTVYLEAVDGEAVLRLLRSFLGRTAEPGSPEWADFQEALREFGERACHGCGRVLPESAFGRQATGRYGLRSRCEECRRPGKIRASKAWAKANPERRREYHDLRRARAMGAEAEEVDRAAVFERDGWICGLCGEEIDPGLRWPDPGSASLDHVVPLSRGGAHAFGNVQASHLSCNVRKGARA